MNLKSKWVLNKSALLALFFVISTTALFAQMRDITGYEIVTEMKAGWNLGNNFDSLGGDETVWGNPTPTQGLINAIRDMGFKTIRIPVSWGEHVGPGPAYTIDPIRLDKVEAVVNWALDAGMYAILNMHHDNSWLIPTYATETKITTEFVAIWTQIANRFSDYNDYLLFELMNEPRVEHSDEEWTGGTAENRDVINHLNQAGVDAVRATGGNNSLRFVVVTTHAAATLEIVMREFVIPADPRIIISQHTYFPYELCFETGGSATWGTGEDKLKVDAESDRIRNFWNFFNVPVIIGEWGTVNKSNTADRIAHAKYYSHSVRTRGMLPIWWDNGYPDVNQFGLINRSTYEWYFPEIARAIVEGAGGADAPPLPTTSPFPGWDCAAIAAWDENAVYYPADMLVKYNGIVYSNRWWTMGDDPELNSLPDYGTWKWLGPCSDQGSITPAPSPSPAITPHGVLGDVNDSGTIDIVDALVVAQYYVGLNPAGFIAANADTDCSGTINIVDALIIAQYYVGLISHFC